MSFFTPEFVFFFLFSFILYYIFKEKRQKYVLFIFSVAFIGLLSVTFLIDVFLFVLVNYIIAIQIEKQKQNPIIKNILYKTGMIFNIGSLFLIKYFNFFLTTLSHLSSTFNVSFHPEPLKIVVPIGISYYTFQGIGYLIQINRGNERPEKNFIILSNYFIFFPKFLSGPIEFSRKLIPQLKHYYSFHYQSIIEGFRLILWGALKKMVIADRLAMIIDGVYPQLHSLSGNPLIITFLIQPLHIYFDFSGYTDIALGIGKIFGIKLTDNFHRPFFSTSVTEFWKRWHISLTSWCNEFIFKRILFNRRKWGVWAASYAVFITFLIIGIWHGPRWTFIVLGILQGIAINYEYFTKKIRIKVFKRLPNNLNRYLSYFFTYLFMSFSLVFFYAPNLKEALYFLTHLFYNIDFTGFHLTFVNTSDKIIILLFVVFMFYIEQRQENGKDIFVEINNWPRMVRRAIYYILIILIIYLGSPGKEFVYMQF